MKKILGLLLVSSMASVMAFPPDAPPPPPPPAAVVDSPPPPPVVQSGEVLEPGVTIIQSEDERIYEYRSGGVLYMVRVVPKVGPPYYFFDQDGDGQLDYQDVDPRTSKVNQWILFQW